MNVIPDWFFSFFIIIYHRFYKHIKLFRRTFYKTRRAQKKCKLNCNLKFEWSTNWFCFCLIRFICKNRRSKKIWIVVFRTLNCLGVLNECCWPTFLFISHWRKVHGWNPFWFMANSINVLVSYHNNEYKIGCKDALLKHFCYILNICIHMFYSLIFSADIFLQIPDITKLTLWLSNIKQLHISHWLILDQGMKWKQRAITHSTHITFFILE